MSRLIPRSPHIFLCLLHFDLFTFAEGKDSQQGGGKKKTKNKKKPY